MGRQTPSTFPWIKKEEADSHFSPRKWGWKAWMVRHLLGIVIIYAYILWNFPQFAPEFDPWLDEMRLVVSQHGVDIVVWLCLLSYRYRIRFSYWQMTIRQLTLTWQTEVAVLVEFAAKMEHPPPFASFASTIGTELSYWILHDIHQFSYLVAYRRTRRFVPHLPSTLKHQILGSLKSVAAQGRTVPFRNLPRRVKRLDFVHVPDLNDLFQKLVLLNPQSRFAFAVLYRFAKVDRIITGEMLVATRQVNHLPLVRIQCGLWASERATRNQLKGLISGVAESRAWVWPKLHLFQPELVPLPHPPFLPQSARASQGHKGTQVGYVKLKNTKVAPYRLEPEDLYHGGVIAGAIGMGKTTLRLALTDLLLRHDQMSVLYHTDRSPRSKKMVCISTNDSFSSWTEP
ncbi:MAG: hypothetical protein D6732_29400 [Methanobacteriota archaeon]|nr:MAG: hypothetical protein D6732_29400 [Euryarchaeota archaeon]